MKGSQISSPEYLRLSLAAAMTLGLRPGRFYRGAQLHCLNLLLTYPEGCYGSCSYCGLSSESEVSYEERSFIRVEWPDYSLDEIMTRIGSNGNSLERICVSMIMHPRAMDDSLFIVERLTSEFTLPVSVLVNPTTLEDGDLEALKQAGTEMVTVAVDAATAPLFDEHRGESAGGPHHWDQYWQVLNDISLLFGRERFGCHLIVGLGETEQEMVEAMQRVRNLGGRSHLFAFYPEEGSRLGDREPCDASRFRRVQLACFLIDYDMSTHDRMEFDELERLVSFGIQGSALDDVVQSGEPFMTSGCPGSDGKCACNRPFGDGPPGDMRSFPFELGDEDIQVVRKQLATYIDISETARARKL